MRTGETPLGQRYQGYLSSSPCAFILHVFDVAPLISIPLFYSCFFFFFFWVVFWVGFLLLGQGKDRIEDNPGAGAPPRNQLPGGRQMQMETGSFLLAQILEVLCTHEIDVNKWKDFTEMTGRDTRAPIFRLDERGGCKGVQRTTEDTLASEVLHGSVRNGSSESLSTHSAHAHNVRT